MAHTCLWSSFRRCFESPLLAHPETISCLLGRSSLFLDSLSASCGALAPFRLCSHSQPQSSSWGLPPKPEPQLPAPTCPSGWADKPLRLVSPGWQRSSVWESLHFALCNPVAALCSVAPKFPPPPATPHLRLCRGFLVCGNFSSFTVSSQRCRSHPYSFVSVFSFFFCPTRVRGRFLAFWVVWGLLPAFSRSCSTCRCISDASVGRKVISTSYYSAILKVSSSVYFLILVSFTLRLLDLLSRENWHQ